MIIKEDSNYAVRLKASDNDITFPAKNVIEAFDSVFKLYKVFQEEFPKSITQLFQFFQVFVYEIESQKKSSAVSGLISSLNLLEV